MIRGWGLGEKAVWLGFTVCFGTPWSCNMTENSLVDWFLVFCHVEIKDCGQANMVVQVNVSSCDYPSFFQRIRRYGLKKMEE